MEIMAWTLTPWSFDGPSFGPVFWHPPLSAGGGRGGVCLQPHFQNREGLDRISIFKRGLAGKERGDFFQRVQFFY